MILENWLEHFQTELAPRCITNNRFIIRSFYIAEKLIRIHFSTEFFADKFCLALQHNRYQDLADSDLDIYVWQRGDLLTKTNAYEKHTDNLPITFHGFYHIEENSISIYQPSLKRAFFWIKDASQLRDWVFAAPFRNIFHWFFYESNVHLFHGAVIGNDKWSVIMTAKGGSGKSTTAMKCLKAGLYYLSDDYVGISSDTLNAYSLYSSLKLTWNNKFLNQGLKEHIWNYNSANSEKAIILLNKIYPKQVRSKLLLKAIFVPEIAKQTDTDISEISKAEALLAILPTTLRQNKQLSKESSSAIKKIVLNLPCFKIRLGSDSLVMTNKIKEFLERIS